MGRFDIRYRLRVVPNSNIERDVDVDDSIVGRDGCSSRRMVRQSLGSVSSDIEGRIVDTNRSGMNEGWSKEEGVNSRRVVEAFSGW